MRFRLTLEVALERTPKAPREDTEEALGSQAEAKAQVTHPMGFQPATEDRQQ